MLGGGVDLQDKFLSTTFREKGDDCKHCMTALKSSPLLGWWTKHPLGDRWM